MRSPFSSGRSTPSAHLSQGTDTLGTFSPFQSDASHAREDCPFQGEQPQDSADRTHGHGDGRYATIANQSTSANQHSTSADGCDEADHHPRGGYRARGHPNNRNSSSYRSCTHPGRRGPAGGLDRYSPSKRGRVDESCEAKETARK